MYRGYQDATESVIIESASEWNLGVFCSANKGIFILANKGDVSTIKISLQLSQMQFQEQSLNGN